MDKQIEVESQDGIVCSNEKEWIAYTQQNEDISKILCSANGAGEKTVPVVWANFSMNSKNKQNELMGIVFRIAAFFPMGVEDIQKRGIGNFLRWLKCLYLDGVIGYMGVNIC